MTQRTYSGNVLIEEWDDETRLYTRWEPDGSLSPSTPENPNPRPYNEEENAQADEDLVQNSRLTTLEGRVAALELLLNPPEPDPVPGETPAAPLWEDLNPPNFWYNETFLEDVDGTVYKNISGTILTTPPSGFPGGGAAWIGQLFQVIDTAPDPDPNPDRPEGYVGTWDPDASYAMGDVVDRDGRYYRCRVAHGAEYNGTWGPPQASVWDDLGPTP